MRLNDLALGGLSATLGTALLVASLRLPGVRGQEFGAGFYPALIGVLTIAAGAGLMLTGLRQRGVPALRLPGWFTDGWAVANAAILAGAIAIFGAFGETIGFLPFAVVLLFVIQWRLSIPAPRAALIAVLGAIGFQLLFGKLLRVPLPPGLFEGLL
ncbi:putative tricarboxylic transport membrane protein [Humitalea rosea]|uniref:Putative tricarboxylic transport membrane protein n=1 Tax=Humitalea rosea TaxID=990373 RepID=A0A2W7IL29_9PROT|nr:tripartite tricarboxylate transporter TctB family protein [Humitalea rosea]PZW46657.1 putative tricarboxylic transport membrane protein [Humitalea rosea]